MLLLARGTPALRVLVCLALAIASLSACSHTEVSPILNQTRTHEFRLSILSNVDHTALLDSGLAVRMRLPESYPVGTHLLVLARFEPFDGPRNPGEPDMRFIETEQGFSGSLRSAHVVTRLPPAKPNARIVLAQFQARARDALSQHLSEPYVSILCGELWGDKGALPPDLRQEFQDSGTVHILVTAGLHLGIVAALLLWVLNRLGLPRSWACGAATLGSWTYVVFSGAHLPSIRAAVMISFGLGARASGRKALSWNALACAVIVILAFNPQAVHSASFTLSISCVGAIILLHDPIGGALSRIVSMPHAACEAIALTLATQIGVWPVTAATFLTFAPYAVIANLAIVPIVGATMILGALQIVAMPIAPLAQSIANLNLWLLQWILGVVRIVGSLPYAHVVMTPAPAWAIAAYDAALLAAICLGKRERWTPAIALLVCAVANVLAPMPALDGKLRITVLDVGQADSIVIQTPRGHVLLVDGGGRLERGALVDGASVAEHVGEMTVAPFLIRHGIHQIDAVLLSHPHGDHAGGVAPVLRLVRAGEFADSGQQYGGFAYNDALKVAHDHAIPIVYPRAGSIWQTSDGVRVHFLSPQLPLLHGTRNDINNNSLVFMIEYKSFRMLFTGDAGAEAEQRILSAGTDLRATVLKVGHHGSAYSSTADFIDAVHPKYAIISVGRHNLFGHPAPSTIERLQRSGASVYRTDASGAITIRTDGTAAPQIQGYVAT